MYFWFADIIYERPRFRAAYPRHEIVAYCRVPRHEIVAYCRVPAARNVAIPPQITPGNFSLASRKKKMRSVSVKGYELSQMKQYIIDYTSAWKGEVNTQAEDLAMSCNLYKHGTADASIKN